MSTRTGTRTTTMQTTLMGSRPSDISTVTGIAFDIEVGKVASVKSICHKDTGDYDHA